MDFDDFSGFAPPIPTPGPMPAAAPTAPPVAPLPFAPMGMPMAPAVRPPSLTAVRAKAGLGVVAAFAGAGAGAVLAGPLGGLAGLAGVGTIRNLYRSQGIASSDPAEQGDAARCLALGVIGVAIVGFLGYKIYQSRKEDS